MRSVGLYRRIRQAYYRDGKAIRELSRETGLHRDTIREDADFFHSSWLPAQGAAQELSHNQL